MKSRCEALRRDGTQCPHGWKHALHAGVSRYRPDHLLHPNLRTVYLCGQHRNALRKGTMVLQLVAPEGRSVHIAEGRDGSHSWGESEISQ